jgi:DNA-binding NarL/FixJ family response regulator
MTDLEERILEAWERVWPWLKEDPEELARRVARRRTPTLTRPMRHECIALRACDKRITAAWWRISPEHAMDLNHPAHPYEPIEHDVVIRAEQLRKFCWPVRVDGWGEEVEEIAKKLGCRPDGLRGLRRSSDVNERKIPHLGGKRGKPVPLIHVHRLLDPSNPRSFAAPPPILMTGWEDLAACVPDDFEQGVVRRPVYCGRKVVGRWGEPPEDHQYKDEAKVTWRWVCPGCRKLVQTIYYPVGVSNLCDWIRFDPAATLGKKSKDRSQNLEFRIQKSEEGRQKAGYRAERVPRNRAEWELQLERRRRWEADAMPRPAGTFACKRCHRVRSFYETDGSGWNVLIAHLTAGLLYGCEVRPPRWYRIGQGRKMRRVRQMTREAPRRQMVLRRLLNGWSVKRIARDMEISLRTVHQHIDALCRQEDVADRHALAAKLGAKCSPPLNNWERAGVRRAAVMRMMLEGATYREIMAELKLEPTPVYEDVSAIFRLHGIEGSGAAARRALAEKLGREYVRTSEDLAREEVMRVREQVRALREGGMRLCKVAKELGIAYIDAKVHAYAIRRAAARGCGGGQREKENVADALGMPVNSAC